MQVGSCGGGQAGPPCTPGIRLGQPCTWNRVGATMHTWDRLADEGQDGVLPRQRQAPLAPARQPRSQVSTSCTSSAARAGRIERQARCGARRVHAPHAHGRQARERRPAGRAGAPEDADGHPQAPRQALSAPERQQLADARMVHRHQVWADASRVSATSPPHAPHPSAEQKEHHAACRQA
jgi:hypothetical protein